MKTIKYLFCIAALLMAACSDNDEPIVPNPIPDRWTIGYDEAQTTVTRYGRYHTLSLTLPEGKEVIASCEASWLHLSADTVYTDGYLDFFADANTDARSRTADIIFTSVTQADKRFALTITQHGEADNADNAMEDLYHVGNGFDAYAEYQSDKSLKGVVIDMNSLKGWAGEQTFQPVQDQGRAELIFEVFTSHSLREMSSKLSETTQKSTNLLFYRKTVERIKNVCTTKIDDQILGYARMQKIVATRSIDEGALKYIVDKCNTRATEDLPFTAEFRKTYNDILNNPSQRDGLIETMIKTYGTHLVTSASMGGSIDYAVTFSRFVSTSISENIERQCEQVFGKNTGEDNRDFSKSITSELNTSNTFQMMGGGESARKALQTSIDNITKADQVLPAEQIQEWLASIQSSDLATEQGRQKLAVVNFHFIPIWQLFPESLHAAIQEGIIKQGEKSNNNSIFSNNELGTDNYELSLPYMRQKFGIDNFSTATNATQARIIYQGKTPVVEVCNEYVPKIRGDRRIPVYYPIRQGVAQIGMGIFPGDGEGNAPAQLIFSDGDCYVNPIDGYGSHDRIDTLYYIHGRLYTDMYNTYVVPTAQCGYQVKDEYLSYFHATGKTIDYPIVKIGSGFWARCNMKDEMYFGVPRNFNDPYSKYYYEEEVKNGMLYANIYYGQYWYALDDNKSVYGPDTDPITGNSLLWYLPMREDVDNLFAYLGHNAKAMFAGQPSGFEAQFAGYRGRYDILTGKIFADSEGYYHGQDQICCIVSKDQDQNNYVHVLAGDYTIPVINPNASINDNWFAVRLYRSANYHHQEP